MTPILCVLEMFVDAVVPVNVVVMFFQCRCTSECYLYLFWCICANDTS